MGLITGLRNINNKHQATIRIIGDSKLIENQIKLKNKATHRSIKHLLQETRQLLNQVYNYEIFYVYRRYNKAADFLANEAMNAMRTKSITKEWNLMETNTCNELEKKLDFFIWKDCHSIDALRQLEGINVEEKTEGDSHPDKTQKKPPDKDN